MTDNQIIIPGYIQKLIEKILKKLNIVNKELKVGLPLKPGDNWLGTILEIETVDENYEKECMSVNLIIKFAPTDKLYRNNFPIRPGYEREIYTYKKILPEFINIQKENNLKTCFIVPKCYYTLFDETQETIVLENMTKHGYKLVNKVHPVDYEHAVLTMSVLGKLHALSFALKNKKPQLFKEISADTEDNIFNSHFRNFYLKITQNIGKRVLNYLNRNGETYEEFEHFVNDPSFVLDKLVRSESAGRYAVLCHGDPQMRNMLFKYENNLEPNTPTKLCLIDWQLCRLCSPCLDIAFFIWTCTDKKLRDSHYSELIETYYTSLSSVLRELGECAEECYPKDVFKKDLKKFSVFGLFISLWVVWTNSLELEDFPDINSATGAESLTDLLSNVANDDDAYFTRIKDIIEDFTKYCYDM